MTPPYSCAPISGVLSLAALKKSFATSLISLAKFIAGEPDNILNHSGVKNPGFVTPVLDNCGYPKISFTLTALFSGLFDHRLWEKLIAGSLAILEISR